MMPARTFAYTLLPLIALMLALPIAATPLAWLFPAGEGFGYLLRKGLIGDYTINSLLISICTGAGALIIGTGTAWAVTMWQFPGRKLLSWLLILPLAMPAYVAAMLYAYLLEGAGPVQNLIRETTGLAYGEYYFPAIRSPGGVVFILTFTLYPYCYLLARGAFASLSRQMLETSLLLGLSKSAQFTRLALPMARPALITSVALVMMESLADFGVVSLYGVPAYTTGIYRIWQGFYDPIAAARLAGLLLLFVLALLWLERYSRGKARYDDPASQLLQPHPRTRAEGWRGGLICLLCALPILLGFALPMMAIVNFTLSHLEVLWSEESWRSTGNALLLASLTAAIASFIGIIFAYTLRGDAPLLLRLTIRVASAGYAIPGSVIAVGVLWLLVTTQNDLLRGEVFLTGTLLGMVWGCVLRFLTISFNSAEAGFLRITPMMDAVATTLGANRWQILRRVHLPILQSAMLPAFLLVFVDTLKELPASLLLRPFNFDTLAIRTYELASDDLLPHAAPTALLLILISLLPVWLLNRNMQPRAHAEVSHG
jgi:iron(III) transport system permease protein